MDDDLPLIFTPLVRQPGIAIPDWLFGPAGVAGLPAPLSPPQGVNVAVGIDIIEVERVRKVHEHHGERFLKRVFTEMEVRQCRGNRTVAQRTAHRHIAWKCETPCTISWHKRLRREHRRPERLFDCHRRGNPDISSTLLTLS